MRLLYVVLSQVINHLTEDRNAGTITGMAFAGVLGVFLIHLAQVWSDKKINIKGQHLMGFLVSSVIIMPLLIDSIGQGNWLLSGTVAVAIMLSIMIAVFFDKWYGKREKRAMEAMTKMELGSRYQYLSEGEAHSATET